METRIDVSAYQLQPEAFKTAYHQLLSSHAELYFVGGGYSFYKDGSTGNVAFLLPTYTVTDKQEIQTGLRKMENVVNEALSLVTEDMEDYEKALVIHDWMAKYCAYDYENYLNHSIPDASYTAYGLFINRTAVCQGYAEAYAYIMQQKLGIPCGVVSSSSMNHAWNMIRLGGNYYHVDVTWDDPTWDCIGRARHAYFLISDATFQTESTSAGRTPHTGWVSDVTAEDTSYESGLWASSDSGVIEHNGTWYYIDSKEMKLKKTNNLLNGTTSVCHTFDKWPASAGSYWTKSFSFLWRYKNKLIFNDKNRIYAMPLSTGTAAVIYKPADIVSGFYIFGFQLDGDTMRYAVQDSPNLKQSQTNFMKTASLPWDRITGEIEIEGTLRYGSTLTAKAVSEAGTAESLRYQWYRDGAILMDETSASYILKASDIGKIITVKAIHADYTGELEASTKAIQKGIPAQPAPINGLKGDYGQTLSTVLLPEEYTWKAPDTIMNQPGNQRYTVVYTPDAELFEEIECELTVTVSDKPACTKHIWNSGIQTKAPSCTEDGVITYTCQNCGDTKTESIPATGHLHIEKRNEKAPSCSEAGYSGDLYCNDCDSLIEQGTITAATGIHSWNDGEIIKAATCTEAGIKLLTCTVCGENTSASIPAAGHLHTEVRGKRPATMETTGYTGDTYCTDCGAKIAFGREIAVTVRAPKKGTILKSQNMYYQVTKSDTKNGTAAFYKVSGTAKKLEIPDTVTIDGITYKVTSIAAKALKNNKKITQVILGGNLTSIEKEAFFGCKNLKKIIIKSVNLKSAGKNAVKKIHKKAVIKCPAKKVKAYKKLFTAKCGYQKKTMKITK